jgi:hypothetical protein
MKKTEDEKREANRAYCRQWYQLHKKEALQNNRAYELRMMEIDPVGTRKKNAERMAKYRKNHPEHIEKNRLCKKKINLRKNYGLSITKWNEMALNQDRKCKLCGRVCESDKTFHVDHSHTDGHIRGLLCTQCNVGIGMFGDSIELLQKALLYLQEN